MKQIPRTLLHLSDVHFGRDHALPEERTPSGRPTLIEALTKDLETSKLRPDKIILSGDLVSTGSREEYRNAKGFLELLGKTFGLSSRDFLIVCGNHDVYWGAAPDSVSRGEYDSFVSSFFRVPVGDGETEPARMMDADLTIIGLDTTRLQRQSASGIGFIGREQLRSAEQLLESGSQESSLKILVLHHHLLPVAWVEPAYPEGKPSLTLDGPSILSWAQEHDFAMILHGHQHQSFLATFHFAAKPGGPLLVAGAPSAAARDLPPQGRNGYHIIQIDGRNITISVRELTEEHRFLEIKRVQFIREAGGTFAATAIPSIRSSREPSVNELRALTRNAAQTLKHVLGEAYGPFGGLRMVVDMTGISHARDGEAIANSLRVEDPIQNRVFAVARDLARSIARENGDGRKTAVLLWAEIVSAGLDHLKDGDEHTLVTSLAAASNAALVLLRGIVQKNPGKTEIEQVAFCAAGNQKSVGSATVEVFKKAGKEGVYSLRRRTDSSLSEKTIYIDVRCYAFDGFELPDWFIEFAPVPHDEIEKPIFILCDGKVAMRPLISALETVQSANRPIFIFARQFDEESLALIAINVRKRALFCVPFVCRSPEHEGVLEDMALLTGGRILNPSHGDDLHKMTMEDVGSARSISVTQTGIFLSPSEALTRERVMKAVDLLRSRKNASESPFERQLLQFRLARLVGAHVIVEAVGVSDKESEVYEREIADAFSSANGAVLEGVVPGAGQALVQIADVLLETSGQTSDPGTRILAQALRLPAQLLSGRSQQFQMLDSARTIRLALTLATEAAIRTLRTRTIEISEGSERQARTPVPPEDLTEGG